MLNDLLVAKCGECGSKDLVWHCSSDIVGGVVQGRLTTDDVRTVFFLGCEYCSSTVKVINGDKVAELLTQEITGN